MHIVIFLKENDGQKSNSQSQPWQHLGRKCLGDQLDLCGCWSQFIFLTEILGNFSLRSAHIWTVCLSPAPCPTPMLKVTADNSDNLSPQVDFMERMGWRNGMTGLLFGLFIFVTERKAFSIWTSISESWLMWLPCKETGPKCTRWPNQVSQFLEKRPDRGSLRINLGN